MFEEKNKRNYHKILFTSILTSLGVALLTFFIAANYLSNGTSAPENQQQEETGITDPQPQLLQAEISNPVPVITEVARSASPGVVGISVLKVDSSSLFDKNATEKWGVGSGVIVSQDGYILTNNHVAGGTNKRLIVSIEGGKNVDGVTVWTEPILDLAVVKINLAGLTTIPLGDSNAIEVGETAVAIGNPLGLQFQRSVTSGIISALNRTIRIDTDKGSNYMEDLIQTDASINPGNSGGPLLNSRGEVIGINTIKVTAAEGMGFAVPINVAVPIIRQLTENGEFKEPYLGVFAYDKEVIPFLDRRIMLNSGIYVANVDKASPAYKAGIKEGCVITKVDGNNINTMIDLRAYLYSKSPEDTIRITHFMNGKTVTVPVKLQLKKDFGLITR